MKNHQKWSLAIFACLFVFAGQLNASTLNEPGYSETLLANIAGNSGGSYGSMVFDSSGNAYVGGSSGQVYKVTPGGVVSQFGTTGGSPPSLGLAIIGTTLYVGFNNGQIRTMDLTLPAPSGALLTTLANNAGAMGMEEAPAGFGAFGGQLVVGTYAGISIVDPTTGTETVLINPPSPHSDIAFTPGGVLLATDHYGDQIVSVAADGTVATFRAGLVEPDGIAIHPVSGEVFVASNSPGVGSISKIAPDGSSSSVFASDADFDNGWYVSPLRFSPDGAMLYYAAGESNMDIFRISGFVGTGEGTLYRISIDSSSSDFSAYDVASDTWTTLTPFPSGTQMATSADGRLFGWNLSAGEIQEYNPVADTWSLAHAAPPASGVYGNLEYRVNGEWVYTQFLDTTLYYTVAGVWQTMTLPFQANSIGDYDPYTDTLVVGEYATNFFHAIDMATLAVTAFTTDAGYNGERARCGQIRDGRFYYQTSDSPIRYLDLSNNAAAPVDVASAGSGYVSCAVSENYDQLFINSLNGLTLLDLSLADATSAPLTGHTSVGNHSSIVWVGTHSAVIQLPDLAISKLDTPDPVVAGTSLTYTVRVDNIGDAVADDVVVTDTLPAGLNLIATAGCVEDPAGVPTCSLGSIAAGAYAEYTITAVVGPSVVGLLANTATAATSSTEPNLSNNSATQNTLVVAQSDLSLSKVASSGILISGGNQMLTYTIEVSNAGPSDATNVVVTDYLSPVLTNPVTAGCMNDPDGVPDCYLGTVPAGSMKSYTITVGVQRYGGTISNSVMVTSDSLDQVSANDVVDVDVEAVPIEIPTLSQLGMMLLILLLGGVGWVGIRRY